MKKIINDQRRAIVKQNTIIIELINENTELKHAFRELMRHLIEE